MSVRIMVVWSIGAPEPGFSRGPANAHAQASKRRGPHSSTPDEVSGSLAKALRVYANQYGRVRSGVRQPQGR